MTRPVRYVATALAQESIDGIAAAISGSTAGPDRELAIHAFRVASAFAGAAIGDLLLAVRVINTSTGSPVAEGSTLWLNETQQTTLGAAPDLADLVQAAFTGLTSAQLAAMTVETDEVAFDIDSANLSLLNDALTVDVHNAASVGVYVNRTAGTVVFEGSLDDVNWVGVVGYHVAGAGSASIAATSNTGLYVFAVQGFKSFRARISVAGANAISMHRSKAPAALNSVYVSSVGTIGSPPKLMTTTRQPVWASGQVVTTSAASAKTAAITGTEVMISCTQDVWIAIGDQATVAAAKDTAGSMFLAKGGPYTFQITSGHGVAAIQDSAAGKVSVLPVA